MPVVRFALVGAGVVGSGVLDIYFRDKVLWKDREGLDLELVGVATRTPSKVRHPVEVTTDASDLLHRTRPDFVLELAGGIDFPFELAKIAFEQGTSLITANKALLSEKGEEIFKLAWDKKLEVGYEAAVAGSIPIIRTFRTGLAGCRFEKLSGILNGTTNYILTQMETQGWDYHRALAKAQELGFAEADPTFDVEGVDAGHKLSLLASLAFQRKIPFSSIWTEGITKLQSIDIRFAKQLGFRIKLLASCQFMESGFLASVRPTLVSLNHPISNVQLELNAVTYNTIETGMGLLTGKGAGSLPTASAVIADLLYYAKRRGDWTRERNTFEAGNVSPIGTGKSRFYLRFSTVDKPGVLAEIASVLGQNSISIASMHQDSSEEPIQVILVTHSALEANLRAALEVIDAKVNIIKENTVSLPLLQDL